MKEYNDLLAEKAAVRRAAMLKFRQQGWSDAKIARLHNLSRQRVGQILGPKRAHKKAHG